MDRVILPGEAPGSATYYMMGAPEDFGNQLYNMELHGKASIKSVLMDLGSDRSTPHLKINSFQEFDDTVRNSKGRTIYSCAFELSYEDLGLSVFLDFQAKRLTITVDPSIDARRKKQLAEFAAILYDTDYYELAEREKTEEEIRMPKFFKIISASSIGILAAFFIVATLNAAGILSLDTAMQMAMTPCMSVCMLVTIINEFAAKAVRRRLRRQITEKRKDPEDSN